MVSFGRDFCRCKGLLEGPRFVAFSPYFNLSQQRVKLGYKVVHHFIPSIVVSERHIYIIIIVNIVIIIITIIIIYIIILYYILIILYYIMLYYIILNYIILYQ